MSAATIQTFSFPLVCVNLLRANGKGRKRHKAVPARTAASAASHSCQTPEECPALDICPIHASSRFLLQLLRRIISPDTSHSPTGNHSSLKTIQAPSLSSCLSSLFFSLPSPCLSTHLSLPHYFSLWPTLSLASPSVFVKPYPASLLSRSIPPHTRLFSPVHTCYASVDENLQKHD